MTHLLNESFTETCVNGVNFRDEKVVFQVCGKNRKDVKIESDDKSPDTTTYTFPNNMKVIVEQPNGCMDLNNEIERTFTNISLQETDSKIKKHLLYLVAGHWFEIWHSFFLRAHALRNIIHFLLGQLLAYTFLFFIFIINLFKKYSKRPLIVF